MNKNVYNATFPLHEGRYDKDGPQGEKSDRRVRNIYQIKRNSTFTLASVYWVGTLEKLL